MRKLAILVTKANKVFDMNTDTSEMVWSKYYGTSYGPGSLKRMFMVKTSSAAPESVLVQMGQEHQSKESRLHSFNPQTGQAFAESVLILS